MASHLLAFYREPVRHRHRFTHGGETLPDGHLVFRFAQGKFPHGVLRDTDAAARARLAEAARFFVRHACLWEGATHYQLLCLPRHARREAIKEHYHALMALVHPDRQDRGMEAWPTDCAPRANLAYAVLSDDARRVEYDLTLGRSQAAAPMREAGNAPATLVKPRRDWRRFAARLRRPALAVVAVVLAVALAQLWLVEDGSRDRMLRASAPFEASAQWVREASRAPAPAPRYLERPHAAAALAPDGRGLASLPILGPLWRTMVDEEPIPVVPDERTGPLRVALSSVPEPALAHAPAVQIISAGAKSPASGFSQSVVVAAERARLAQAGPAQATGPTPAETSRPAGLSDAMMETLLARLVAYYEAGDLDRLLALYDPASIGVWDALQVRHAFETFFRDTRDRKLRLRRVTWQLEPQAARARGEASVSAEYLDAGRQQRDVPIEVDVVMRGGQARIARLILFPQGG